MDLPKDGDAEEGRAGGRWERRGEETLAGYNRQEEKLSTVRSR